MRVLAVIAIAMLLAGCEGDRIKQSMDPPQEQQHFGLLA
jgi:PBP1b-binding outer membrane lipoprotein LpoB